MKRILRSQSKLFWSAIIGMIAGIRLVFIRGTGGKMLKYSISHDGLRRRYNVYVPSSGKGSLRPAVFVLHGRGGNAISMVLLTRQGFNRLAERDGFIVVYPDGIEMSWNDGRKDEEAGDRPHRDNINDVGFISLLTDLMISDYKADPKRIYVTGISNGAIMAYRLACELSHKIAAIAPVDGNIPGMLLPACIPELPVPVLAINNTDDPVVPYEGGIIKGSIIKVKLGKVLSVNDSIRFWVEKNRCSATPVVEELPDIDPGDGSRVIRKTYNNAPDGAEVILYAVDGGGHTWPGGLQYLPAWLIGTTCRDFDACEAIWDFFKRQSR